MKFMSDHDPLLERIETAFAGAVEDTLEDARVVARERGRSGTFERSLQSSPITDTAGRLRSSIGSPLASARAKEKGAYIEAKRSDWLTFKVPDGTFRRVKAVRLPPRPVVSRAGPRFIDHMSERLRAVATR